MAACRESFWVNNGCLLKFPVVNLMDFSFISEGSDRIERIYLWKCFLIRAVVESSQFWKGSHLSKRYAKTYYHVITWFKPQALSTAAASSSQPVEVEPSTPDISNFITPGPIHQNIRNLASQIPPPWTPHPDHSTIIQNVWRWATTCAPII